MDSDEDDDGGEDTETDPDMWTDLRYKRVIDWKVGVVTAIHAAPLSDTLCRPACLSWADVWINAPLTRERLIRRMDVG